MASQPNFFFLFTFFINTLIIHILSRFPSFLQTRVMIYSQPPFYRFEIWSCAVVSQGYDNYSGSFSSSGR